MRCQWKEELDGLVKLTRCCYGESLSLLSVVNLSLCQIVEERLTRLDSISVRTGLKGGKTRKRENVILQF